MNRRTVLKGVGVALAKAAFGLHGLGRRHEGLQTALTSFTPGARIWVRARGVGSGGKRIMRAKYRIVSVESPIWYNVYRSTDPNLPKDQWTKVNAMPLPDPKIRDSGLKSGTTY